MPSIAVTVISPYNLPKKSGLMDKTDPYVMVQVGAQKQKTSTKENAGSEAQYNEVLNFTYNGEPNMVVSVWDDEKRKDVELGNSTIQLTPDVLRHGFRGALPMMDKKERQQGEVLVHIAPY
eukprot:Gregarina_sp_Pseudo_9__3957@NODE_4100_length_486_cov_1952_431767_g3771_i0_p1_GENE_NODE_4100_length_486_cov_1952_431767_g3771_i0NODE_4100_length_486_cov_1952_431767_g3771_i0_p1_ORF_typecomplete_len121_score34_39C2/PF00168_30/5_6e143HAO/PF06052_12/0_018_NODE_4100_length_486_cov_1952_431767_g3771_i0124486